MFNCGQLGLTQICVTKMKENDLISLVFIYLLFILFEFFKNVHMSIMLKVGHFWIIEMDAIIISRSTFEKSDTNANII